MKKPYIVIPLALVLVALIVSGCTPGGNDAETTVTAEPAATSTPVETSVLSTPEPAATVAESTELVLTLEELALYNGQNGNPAYIAVDGVIYDVTDVPQWRNGEHNGFSAGNDLTDAIKNVSPHGVSKLKLVKAVGKLAD